MKMFLVRKMLDFAYFLGIMKKEVGRLLGVILHRF